ncbi:Gfo/Idh/MocA family protein [Candidatus Allofournierella merdipullorum]|uniref:Gfo/Idh/MocA family protein n=1 Tax=Candidatus Allofournierella merdipullorum TaxID=2838595 RepID=UPI002A8940B6|nr:Gfo/Idh/MocA family oxidoreductase [Candidatus Fournierella merdipullorum]
MKQLKAGVVGVGFIGAVHIEQLRRLGNVEVVALADEAGAQEKADALYVPHAYTNYKDMIDNEQLDCVHICTPNSTHYEIAMYAMERGVNVVCEKPMTCSVEEAEKLQAYAKEKGLVNAMNFNCRFYPMAYQMRQMVRSGEVGDIYTVHGGYLQDWLFLDTDYSWRLEPEFTGASRAFADIGSHWIDLVEYITGLRAVEVMADFAIFHKTRKKPTKEIATYSGMALRPEDYEEVPINTEDYATVLFHMENGACVSCNISQVFAGRKNQMIVSVAGSRCALHWDSENSNALWIGRRERDNGELVKDPSILDAGTKGVISYPGGHVEGFPDTFKQNFKKIYAAIAGGKPEDYATFEDGLREMRLCEKIVESARERRWVSLV